MSGDPPPPRRVLELAETILRALEQAGVGITIASETPDGPERVYTNRAAADIFGIATEDLDRVEALSNLAPGELEQLAELRERLRRGAEFPARLRTRIARPDGEQVPVELRMTTELVDGKPTVFAFVRDVSEETRMAEALRTSEANFRALAEAAPDSIAVTRDGVVLYMNPAGARFLGFDDPAELVGKHLGSFLLPEDTNLMWERLQRRAAGEELPPHEYRARRRDGEIVVIEISSIFIEYHGASAVLALGRNVTERRQHQAELMQADRMATVGTLAAGVAHEINNPLTYVLLHLERLWRMLPDLVPDDAHRAGAQSMIAEALEGAERMRAIVRDLLAFSRPDNREQRRVDVRQILDSTVKLASTGLKHRATMITHYDEIPPITSNPSRLGQVFLNVIINALQAVEHAGRDGVVDLWLRHEDSVVVVEIADNGPGIAPHLLSRIFDPFFTTKPIGTGTGLGLPISRSIVAMLGGSIAVDNGPHGGVVVRVALPVGERIPAPPPPAPVRRVAPGERKRTALVVDDEQCVARALATLLKDVYDTTICTDSEEALGLLLDQPEFDVVFCDVIMPAPSGIDIYRRLREARPDYTARFVLVTGGATNEQVASALRECGAPVLAKPFELEEVLELAEAICSA